MRTTKRDALQRLAALDEGARGEFVGGELAVLPRAADERQAARTLALELGGPSLRAGNWRFRLEPRLDLGGDLFAPAVAAWRSGRRPPDLTAPSLTVAPFWIAEILSPANARVMRAARLPAYALATIEWIWLLDPAAHTVEIYRRIGDRWLVEETIAGEATIRAAPFTDRSVDLGALWPGAEAGSPSP